MRIAGMLIMTLLLLLSHLGNASSGHPESARFDYQTAANPSIQPSHREFVAEITAYTDDVNSCGKDDGITASGIHVEIGHIAMDESIPFGTKVRIEGIGEFVVTDRGGAITGNRIDIYMPTHSQAITFGRQFKKVQIIDSIK